MPARPLPEDADCHTSKGATDENKATTRLSRRIVDALVNVEPGSELDQVLRRWKGHNFKVKFGEKWLLSGFTDIFQHALDIMHAADPSIDPRLPAQCCDPDCIARFFRIPQDELVRPTRITGPKGKPGRKPFMDDVADFAFERRQKEIPWKEIFAEWRQTHPNDGRNITFERLREAYYRTYRRRRKPRRWVSH